MPKLTVDPPVTPDLVAKHGLTPEEFERVKKILGREPNFTELGIFSVMWSEHCSYKNSRKELKKFPTTGPNILVKAGEENAGVVDIGDGWAIAFKIESPQPSERDRTVPGRGHRSRRNHSRHFHHGRAPGVLPQLLALWTILNHKIRMLDSGCWIKADTLIQIKHPYPVSRTSSIAANRRLFTGVVSGIAHYGNCIGIPTIGGEIYFDESFEGNPLVNVFCLGVLRHEQLARGAPVASATRFFTSALKPDATGWPARPLPRAN